MLDKDANNEIYLIIIRSNQIYANLFLIIFTYRQGDYTLKPGSTGIVSNVVRPIKIKYDVVGEDIMDTS